MATNLMKRLIDRQAAGSNHNIHQASKIKSNYSSMNIYRQNNDKSKDLRQQKTNLPQ